MAVRLQLKLGVVAEQDRLPDSPDTIVVVEPTSAPSRGRRATCTCWSRRRIGGNRAREATRLAAETIRNEYYYDESAGHPASASRRRSSSPTSGWATSATGSGWATADGPGRSASASRSSAATSCTSRRSARPRPT